jgi:hypothetical protein
MAVTIGISLAIEIAIYLASDIAVDMAIYIAVEIANDLTIVFAIENASDFAIDFAIDIAFNVVIDMAFDMAPLDFCSRIFLIQGWSERGMDKLYQIGAAGRNLLSEDEARSLHPGYHLRAPAAVDA